MILAQEEYSTKNKQDSRSFWKDVILYVTIEPCVMCASALRQLGMYSIGALCWIVQCTNELDAQWVGEHNPHILQRKNSHGGFIC